jgi:hypothetical protein
MRNGAFLGLMLHRENKKGTFGVPFLWWSIFNKSRTFGYDLISITK